MTVRYRGLVWSSNKNEGQLSISSNQGVVDVIRRRWILQAALLLPLASVVGLTWIRKGTIVVGGEKSLRESPNRLSTLG
jgi:hypothetical protein